MSSSPQFGNARQQYKPGDWIAGEYHVLEVFGGTGRSGQGVVYLVEEREASAPFVLKTIQGDQDASGRSRLIREAEVWVSLGFHPYIVPAFWVRELDDQLFVAAEFICPDAEGRSTITHYIADGPLPLPVVCRWAVQFCDGLQYAVDKGLRAHRDVKPDNLMVGSDYELRITDFGLADLASHGREVGGGTPLYMAPEQFTVPEAVDCRADIYAFGIVLFQLITGGAYPYRLPQVSVNAAVSLGRMHLEQEPIRAPGELAGVVLRCLAKHPSERPSIAGLRLLLQHVATASKIRVPDRPSVHSRSDEAVYAKARSFAALGKPEQALEAIREYTSRYPDRACGWTEASRFFLETGDARNSVAAALESLKRDSTNSHAWNNLGVAFQKLGDTQQSIDAFRSAVLCDPYNTGALMQLALLLMEVNKCEESAQLFARALLLRPKKQSLKDNAGNAAALMAQKSALRPAQKVLETLLTADPEDSNARFNLALVYDGLRLNEAAIGSYREFLATNPNNTVAHLHLARLLRGAGQFEAAIRHCDVCIEAGFERARASFYKARSLICLDRRGEALRALRWAAQLERDSEPLWFDLAESEEQSGNRAEALRAASHCRQLLTDNGEQATSKFADVRAYARSPAQMSRSGQIGRDGSHSGHSVNSSSTTSPSTGSGPTE